MIINEIMADPSPVVGLPNAEWIELKNTSTSPVNLQGWRIADQTGVSGPMPAFILKPDSLIIICTSSAASLLSIYGPCITVSSFPSLDNDGDLEYVVNNINEEAYLYENRLYNQKDDAAPNHYLRINLSEKIKAF